jgi:hypothetical protein
MKWTDKKRKYLAMLSDPKCRLSRNEIAEQLDVHSATLRNWEKDDGFRQALSDIKADEREDREWVSLKAVLYQKAMEGDVAAARLLWQMKEPHLNQDTTSGITLDQALELIGKHLSAKTRTSTNTSSGN